MLEREAPDSEKPGTKEGQTVFPQIENEDSARETLAEMERYCAQHPSSPSATRRPRVMWRGHTCVALLGSTLEDGIAGLGGTVGAALRAFDVRYSNSLKARRG